MARPVKIDPDTQIGSDGARRHRDEVRRERRRKRAAPLPVFEPVDGPRTEEQIPVYNPDENQWEWDDPPESGGGDDPVPGLLAEAGVISVVAQDFVAANADGANAAIPGWTAVNPAIMRHAAINGLAALEFVSGEADAYEMGPLAQPAEWTTVAVVKPNDHGAILSCDSTPSFRHSQFKFWGSDSFDAVAFNPQAQVVFDIEGGALNLVQVVSGRRSATYIHSRVNGTGGAKAAANATVTGSGLLTFGGQRTNLDNYEPTEHFGGLIAEVHRWPRFLSDAEVLHIEAHLMAKYNAGD